jgi:hypothetical protein
MLSNIAIAFIAAQTVAGVAIKRDEHTASCTNGQASATIIAYRGDELSPTPEAMISSSIPVVVSYEAVVPSSSTISTLKAAISSPSTIPGSSSTSYITSALSSASSISVTSSSVVPGSSSTPIMSSYPIDLLSSTPLSSFTAVISSTVSSHLSSVLPSSSMFSDSSIVISSTTVSSMLISSNVATSSPSSPSTASSVLSFPSTAPSGTVSISSSLTPFPQSSGYSVGQSSSIANSSGITLTTLSVFGSGTGCVSTTTETVYVTAPISATTVGVLTTIYMTSTQYVTLLASSSIMSRSGLAPTPGLEPSGYPVDQPSSSSSSSSPIFTIPESSMVPSVRSSLNSFSEPSQHSVETPSSAPASSLAAPSSPGISHSTPTPLQPTPSFYTGVPPLSYGRSNNTVAYPTGTAGSKSPTLVPTSSSITSSAVPISTGSSVSPLLSSAVTPSYSALSSTTEGYSMATISSSVSPSSSSAIAPSSSAISSPTPGYQTATPSLTTSSTPAVVVVPTSADVGYAANIYKRDATTVHLEVMAAQSLVSTTFAPTTAPKESAKSTSSTLEGNTNTPKSSSSPKPDSSSKSSAGDEIKAIVVSQDSRCPYPYPGIHCGEPTTTTTTIKHATPTLTRGRKKTGLVASCPYLYPGGKGEACL